MGVSINRLELSLGIAVCPESLDQIYTVTYCTKGAKNSWQTVSTPKQMNINKLYIGTQFSLSLWAIQNLGGLQKYQKNINGFFNFSIYQGGGKLEGNLILPLVSCSWGTLGEDKRAVIYLSEILPTPE